MRVKDHKKFAYFKYESEPSETHQLGDILYQNSEDGEEIGVVLQTYSDGECRTDMWGNGSGELATLEQIERIRPELIPEIEWELNS